jgi:hypothetical protein
MLEFRLPPVELADPSSKGSQRSSPRPAGRCRDPGGHAASLDRDDAHGELCSRRSSSIGTARSVDLENRYWSCGGVRLVGGEEAVLAGPVFERVAQLVPAAVQPGDCSSCDIRSQKQKQCLPWHRHHMPCHDGEAGLRWLLDQKRCTTPTTVSDSGTGRSAIQLLRFSWNSRNAGTVGRGFSIPSSTRSKITKGRPYRRADEGGAHTLRSRQPGRLI